MSFSKTLDWKNNSNSSNKSAKRFAVAAPRTTLLSIKTERLTPAMTSTPSSTKKGVRIPLHAGSQVFVYKEDLIRIYSTRPAVYTAHLAELVFGKKVLTDWKDMRNFGSLEPLKMCSITSECRLSNLFGLHLIDLFLSFAEHVVQLFQRSEIPVTETMVRGFVKQHLRELQKQEQLLAKVKSE